MDGPLASKLVRLYRISNLKHSSVRSFLDISKGSVHNAILWTRPLIDRDREGLLQLQSLLENIHITEEKDVLRWTKSSDKFSSKQFLHLYSKSNDVQASLKKGWNCLWSIKLPPKIKIFLWKLHWCIVPTRYFLSKRIHNLSQACVWCGHETETVQHLFWDCEIALEAWDFVGNWWSNKRMFTQTRHFSLIKLFRCFERKLVSPYWNLVVASTCWSIWLARNEVLFMNKRVKREELEFLIQTRVEKWGKATNILGFGNDPLWKVNPHGAIALYSHKISKDYWHFKHQSFDIVCTVDGAWGISVSGHLTGGIRVASRDNVVLIYTYSQETSRSFLLYRLKLKPYFMLFV